MDVLPQGSMGSLQMESQLPNDAFWKLSKFQFLLLGLGVEGREDKAARDPLPSGSHRLLGPGPGTVRCSSPQCPPEFPLGTVRRGSKNFKDALWDSG